MTTYVAALVHDETVIVIGQGETYDEAMKLLVQHVERHAGPTDSYWRRAVLIDSTSIQNLDEVAMHRLITTDPLLRAVFELGKHWALQTCGVDQADIFKALCGPSCTSGVVTSLPAAVTP